MDLTRYDKLRSAIRRTLSPDEAAAADRALEYAAEHTACRYDTTARRCWTTPPK